MADAEALKCHGRKDERAVLAADIPRGIACADGQVGRRHFIGEHAKLQRIVRRQRIARRRGRRLCLRSVERGDVAVRIAADMRRLVDAVRFQNLFSKGCRMVRVDDVVERIKIFQLRRSRRSRAGLCCGLVAIDMAALHVVRQLGGVHLVAAARDMDVVVLAAVDAVEAAVLQVVGDDVAIVVRADPRFFVDDVARACLLAARGDAVLRRLD